MRDLSYVEKPQYFHQSFLLHSIDGLNKEENNKFCSPKIIVKEEERAKWWAKYNNSIVVIMLNSVAY